MLALLRMERCDELVAHPIQEVRSGTEPPVRDVRARLAFYVFTPAYRPAVEYHGLGDLARQLSLLARAQDWEKMPGYISYEILNLFAVIGTYDEIAERCAGIAFNRPGFVRP
jgi:hypothetical protein